MVLLETSPYSLFHFCSIALLDLGLNQIPGPIPDSVGDMSSLRVLALDFNELTGEIPGSIGDLSTSLGKFYYPSCTIQQFHLFVF